MPVTIDFAMMDIGMILMIVVLPVMFFLMKSEDEFQQGQDFHVKVNVEFCADSAVTEEPGSFAAVVDTDANGAAKHDGYFVERLACLPAELCGGVSRYLNLADVANASASCPHLQDALWKSSGVWQVLASRYGADVKDLSPSKSREKVRLAAQHDDFEFIKDIAIEVKKYPPGAPAAPSCRLLVAAGHFIRRLRPSDGFVAKELCELVNPSLTCHNAESTTAAKDLLEAARRSSLPQHMLEALDDSYEHGLLQQNLFASWINEHEDMLDAQLLAMQASMEEDKQMQSLIDYSLIR